MRIIGELDHNDIKITVFKMNERISIKFEQGLAEQIYKFRDGSIIETMEDVKKLLNQKFLGEISASFDTMAKTKFEAMQEMVKAQGYMFPKIV